jgi:amino acid adenylation domain-containing protein
MSSQNVQDIYQLSPAQQSMLLYLLLSGYRSEVYFDQYVATLADVDPEALRSAWQTVIDRHAVLRTLFVWEKREQPLQVVRRKADVPWQEHDWRELPEAERERRLADFLREDHALGFDLGKAPLMRVALIRMADDAWKMIWSFSHLVLDGWSIAVVLSELPAVYAAAREGRAADLPPVRPFRDYIGWLKRQDPARAEEHWRQALAGFEPSTPLPFDGTGGEGGNDWKSENAERRLVPDTVREIQALARRCQITPNTLLQGLWGLLLGRWGAVDDVVYGVIVSGRPFELDGIEQMAGMFINGLPLRLRIDPTAELIPWLQRLQAEQFELREFEYCSMEQILVWSGMPRTVPLFESMLVYENYPSDPLGMSGESVLGVREASLKEAGNFALTLFVSQRGDRMSLRLSYHWDRFSAQAAGRIVAGLEALILAVLENPEARLGDLPLLRPEEQRELIAAGAGPVSGPVRLPVHRRFQEQAARTPDAPAIVSAEGTLTYADLDRASRRLAGRLRGRGVGPESIVGLCAERSPEMVVGMLAVLEAGGAYLPLDPAYPAERLAWMLEDSGARVLLTQERLLPRLPVQGAEVVLLDGIAGPRQVNDVPPPSQDVEMDRLAYVIYTSGSTGRPKGVLVPHATLAHYVEGAAEAFGITPADRVLQFASISFDTSGEEIYPCLTRGAALVLRDDEMAASLQRFAREVERQGVTVLDLPTAYWHEIVAEMEQGLEIPASLRLVILGGEQAQRERLDVWRELVGDRIRLLNTYGPTETTIVTTRRELTGPAAADFRGDVPIGRPIEDAHAYVAGSGQELLPAGLEGELLIGGLGVVRGYLGRPGLTAERFVPDPYSGAPGARLYRTGDLVRLLPGGDLQFRGRTDNQVKVRGYRIELGEIESALRAIPTVRDAVVAAQEKRGGGGRLVAWVVPREGRAPAVGELRSALQEALPEYMVPSVFSFLGELPRTPSGKVDRRAVAAMEADEVDLGFGFAAPRNQVEEILAGIWSELLGVERVGIHDDFFQLGGHSLLVARLASRVRQILQIELPMVEVFKKPTIAALGEAVERAERARDVPELPPIRRAPRDRAIPLSFPQERIWFLDQLSEGGNIAYNFQVTIWFWGALDPDTLRRTLEELVRRHEVLRTSFPTVHGRPVQVIHPPTPIELPVVDLRGVPAGERQEVSERILAETVRKPFDISRLPLIRWRLLRLEDELYELIQVEHHFVHDGWSFAVMLREIKAIYEAFAAGQPSPLPEPPIQYADFAVWQREWMEGPVMDQLLGYWRGRLAGSPGVLELPTDRPRPSRQTFRGDLELSLIPAELYQDLRTFSRREGFTLYMTMLAAFFSLLRRYTGQEDILLGSSNANRRSRELEGMIGMVVNSLVLRGDLAGDPPFRELLERVRQVTLEAYAHQDMPFERLVQELRPERQLGRNPLFQVMFNFHDAAVPDLEFGGLQARFLVRGNRSSKMDLNVIVIPRAEQRVGEEASDADRRALLHWEYSTELFDLSTMHRMIGHYLNVLRGVLDDPGRRLSELPMLVAEELEQVLRGWNRTAAEVPERPVHRLFEERAALAPGAPAVAGREGSLTYGELERRANRLAHRLRRLGVGPESVVALLLERSPDLAVAALATLKAGGAYLPVDPAYPAERVLHMLRDSGASALLGSSATLEALPEVPLAAGHVLDLDVESCAEESAEPPRVEPEPENLAYVIYTSGSTGAPKGTEMRHRGLSNLAAWHCRTYGLSPADRSALVAGPGFDASVWELWPALTAGASLHVPPAAVVQSPAGLAVWLAERRITVAFLPTPLAEAVLAEPLPEGLALRALLTGGDRLHRRPPLDLPFVLVNHYGPTESTVVATAGRVEPLGERSPDLGQAIANTRVLLLDRGLGPVPAGVPGELCVAGEGLARGYRGRPELTAERFVPDPFGEPGERLYRTGDLARRLPGGEIEFLGRIDHQVKIRGFRIELGEIEAALVRHPAVREAAVLARAESGGGAQLLAWVAARPEEAPAARDLRQFLMRTLPDYMVPSAFMVLDALPLTAHGKVDRKALPMPEAARSGEEAFVEPRTPVEEKLAAIWSEVLGVERVGARDDFFLLGGHSLSAARILSRVRDSLGVDLTLAVVFETRTVEGMAAAAAAAEPAGPALPEDPILARAAGLSDGDLDALLEVMLQEESS